MFPYIGKGAEFFSLRVWLFLENCVILLVDMKTHVLHIAECAGGVDCYLRMLLAHMDGERYVHTLVCSREYREEDYRDVVERFVQLDMHHALSPRGDYSAVREVRRLIQETQPDIVYCHSSKAGGIGRLANIGTGIPLVYNPHGWAFSMEGKKRGVYLAMERILAPLTTQFVTISNYEKLIAVERHLASSKKIKTIFNGIDIEAVERQAREGKVTRESLGIPEDAYVVGMVGRISAQKAPDTFVRMAQEVKKQVPVAWFIIVGDGDEKAETERLIEEKGLSECFTITGWVDNPMAYTNLFNTATLLSRWEGFGLVLAEYMALSKPIVATEVDAIPDLVIDHENGLLVGVDNPIQTAKAVVEIYQDNTLRNDMIEKGHLRAVALFDIRRTAREHERLFAKLLRGGGRI